MNNFWADLNQGVANLQIQFKLSVLGFEEGRKP